MMTKIAIFFLALSLCVGVTSAQALHFPRDPEKLMQRAQAYWAYMVAGQKIKALDLILPEKKDAFLAVTTIPVMDAKVESVNTTTDVAHATLRTQVHAILPGVVGATFLEVPQQWVWRNNNWYLDVTDDNPFSQGPHKTTKQTELQKDIDQKLKLPDSTVSFGTIVKGKSISIDIPVNYSGELPLIVELAIPYPAFSIPRQQQLKPDSKKVTVNFESSDWENTISVPLRLRFGYQGATVERTVTVQGTVFAPITFRQVPPDGPAKPDDPFSVFVRNNTSNQITLHAVTTESKAAIVKETLVLEPNQETEFVLKLLPDETNYTLLLFPEQPVEGIGQFSYRIRTSR